MLNSEYQVNYKNEITNKIVDYGLKFISIMSLPLVVIAYFAVEASHCFIIRLIPFILSLTVLIIYLNRSKINIDNKLWIFIASLFVTGIYALVLGLIDMASLWFVVAIIYALFSKTKKLPLHIFLFSLLLIICTGICMYVKNPYIPIDYGFKNCHFACISIRIINFIIIGFLILKILKMFLSTIELYINGILEKNIILEQLNLSVKKEAEHKLGNQILKNDMDKQELDLKYKRKELAEAYSKIMQFNILLSNIKTDILNKKYNEAIVTATANQLHNYNMENFIVKFNEMYSDFRTKLCSKFPQFSTTEVNVCLLITSGLKSAEAAQLLNVTETSIAKYRNRIRKKIGLNNNADIAMHLLDLFGFS